ESKAPRRGEGAADGGHPQELSVLIKNRHRSHPRSGISLGYNSGRRIGHIDIPVDVLHVERDESGWHPLRGRKCAGGEVRHWGKFGVEDVDAAGTRTIGGVQSRLSQGGADGKPSVESARARHRNNGVLETGEGGDGAVQISKDEAGGRAIY